MYGVAYNTKRKEDIKDKLAKLIEQERYNLSDKNLYSQLVTILRLINTLYV